MEISDIGSTDETALNCHTNNRDAYIRGDWLSPDRTRVANVPGFSSDIDYIGHMVVRLKRTTGTPPEGIYHYSVDDNDECTAKKVYVGLHNNAQGLCTIDYNNI